MKEFIPTTIARSIGDGVYFRPIKSWHSLTYAGEGLETMPGSIDRSGCVKKDAPYFESCSPPYTVTHRLYWHESNPEKTVSAFLSYPNRMGCSDEYFWETYGIGEDVERHFGETAEADMEEFIRQHFNKEKT